MIYPKITSIDELIEELESGEYNYYGLRGAHRHDLVSMERGYLDCSYVWEDGERTDEELLGTCAVAVSDSLSEKEILKRYKIARDTYAYNTGVVLLIGDKRCEYGEDEYEIILGSDGYGADVLAIVELE